MKPILDRTKSKAEAQEVNKRMKEKAAHACHALRRVRVVEEIRLRKGHLKLVLSVIDGAAFSRKGRIAGDLMTIDLTRDEIWFLKALRAASERGRIVSAPASRAGLAHLVEVQYVTEHRQSERKTLYIITDRGRQALANEPQ